MSERRAKKVLGGVRAVLLYPKGMGNCSIRMMAVHAGTQLRRNEFFFDGENVHFKPEDAPLRKFIVYESIEQVQRTTRGTTKVRLRP